jgi:hypothetical protein
VTSAKRFRKKLGGISWVGGGRGVGVRPGRKPAVEEIAGIKAGKVAAGIGAKGVRTMVKISSQDAEQQAGLRAAYSPL